MTQGIALFRRSQSRWIARQLTQATPSPRPPATWRKLFAAFERRYPHGGIDGQRISLQQYKNHVAYVERKFVAQRDGGRTANQLIAHDRRGQEQAVLTRGRKRTSDELLAAEVSYAVDGDAVSTHTDPLVRQHKHTRAAKPMHGDRENVHGGEDILDKKFAVAPDERDRAGGKTRLSQTEWERDRLVVELRECQAALKRTKQSAHMWKGKYEELVAKTPSAADTPLATRGPDHCTFTMNINVDVAQPSSTTRHSVRVGPRRLE